MSAPVEPNIGHDSAHLGLSKARVRRARITGAVLVIMAVFVALVFVPQSSGDSTFGLSTTQDRIQLQPLSIASAPALWLIAGILGFLGVMQFRRTAARRATLLTALGFGVFLIAMIFWASAGQQFSLVGMLVSTVNSATPLALGALSGILCERSGVVNIGIEGMMLGGAFSGVVIGSLIGGWAGLLAATLTGGLIALLLAVLAVNFRVDQIIIGVVINLLVLGLTSFLTTQVLTPNPDLNDSPIFEAVKIPLLGDIPVLGPVVFDQTVIVYGMYVLVGLTTFALFRTRWGLRTRSVGEHPHAAESLGISVAKVRYLAVVYGGLVAGFAGAWFTIGTVGRFDQNTTAGRGFIGLAAMIVGGWNPIGALGAALVFGLADSVQEKFAVLDNPIPSVFLGMAPYIVTIVVVAGLVGRSRAPAADGQPFEKQ